MLSKAKISKINSLENKKFRREFGLFVVEGEKMLLELAHSGFEVVEAFVTADFESKHPELFKTSVVVKEGELSKISFLKTATSGLAVVSIPSAEEKFSFRPGSFFLALDGVRDPGNLGTIIRTADWFGISGIVCSADTVDCYNPKTIQASMGSIFRVKISYLDLPSFLAEVPSVFPIFGTDMVGENLFQKSLNQGIVVLGNEAEGINLATQKQISQILAIPRLGQGVESLNVAISAAIICAEYARTKF
jgi:TrmH family RNA methyltransferase